MELAALEAPQIVELVVDLVLDLEDPLGLLEEDAARLGQGGALAAAIEEHDAVTALQRLYLLADRRLGHEQVLRHGREIPLAGDRAECS